jgi:hypothetical protein
MTTLITVSQAQLSFDGNQDIFLTGAHDYITVTGSGAYFTDQGNDNIITMGGGAFSQSGSLIFDGVTGDNNMIWAASDNGGISLLGSNNIVHVTGNNMWIQTEGGPPAEISLDADNINTQIYGDGNVIAINGLNDGLVVHGDNSTVTQTSVGWNSYIVGDNTTVTDTAVGSGVTIRGGSGTIVHMLGNFSGVSNYGGGPVQIFLDADNIAISVNGDGTTNQITMNGTGDQLNLFESNQFVTAFHTGTIAFYNGSANNTLELGGTEGNIAFSLSANGQDLTITDGANGAVTTLVGEFTNGLGHVDS